MPQLKVFLASTLAWLFIINLPAQVYADRFEQVRSASSDLINPTCITQDSLGFLWIGSASGLYRYDGFEFKKWSHQPDRPNSLPNNFVRKIFVDREGYLWLLHRPGGLSIYQPAQDSFINPENWINQSNPLLNERFYAITQDQDGSVWLGGDKGLECITKLDINQQIMEHRSYSHPDRASNFPPAGLIRNLTISDDNNLWMGGQGGVARLDFESDSISTYYFPDSSSDQRCYALFQASEGSMIAFFQNQPHPWKISSNQKEPERLESLTTNASDQFYGIVDAKGNWWITEAGYGLHHYQTESDRHQFYSTRYENEINIKGDYLVSPYLDREGNLWLCGGMHLQVLRNTHKDIQNFPLTHQGQNRTLRTWTNDSILIAGQIYGGVVILDLERRRIERILAEDQPNGGLLDNRCSGIIPKGDNSFWICGREALYSLDLKTKSVELYAQRPDDIIRTLLVDHIGRHWLLWTAGDLMLLDTMTKETEIFFPEIGTQFGARDVRSGYVDSKNQLWLGTIDGGLIRVQPDSGVIEQFLADTLIDPGGQTGRVNYLYPFGEDHFLIGTNAGIFKFDVNSQRFSQFLKTEDGLSSNTIRSMKQTNDSTLWVLTNYGLNRVSLPDLSIRSFFKEDGFQNNYYLSTFQAPSGRLIFSGQSGISIVDEHSLNDHPVAPKLIINDISVWNQPIQLDHAPPYLTHLSLDHDQDLLSIELTALHQQAPGLNEYAYRLIGLQDDWVYLGNRRNLDFVNLSPGHYQLELKAANSDGVWQRKPTSLSIYIKPAFWQTLWFKTLVGLLALGSIYMIVQRRLARYRKENELRDQIKALENQALNAQMNPHFLFNCLNSIKAYIGQSDVDTAQRYLQEFSQLIRRTLQQGRRESVRLQDELDLLRHYLNLEQFRFHPSFTYQISVAPNIQTDFIELPPMLVHPYVENAIWHGLMHKEKGRRHLDIAVKRKGDWIQIMIEDTGIGRELAATMKTRTAARHQSLGMSLTSDRLRLFTFEGQTASAEIIDLKDEKKKAIGTRVILSLPIPE
ncbi:MAG: histidine kinase [Bacteroidota bacterium]